MRRTVPAALALCIVPAGLLLGLVIGTSSGVAASVLVFAWIAPVALLLAGWFDPRLAAAATTIVFARLAASGFGELGRALAVLQEHGAARPAAALAGDGQLGCRGLARDPPLDTPHGAPLTGLDS